MSVADAPAPLPTTRSATRAPAGAADVPVKAGPRAWAALFVLMLPVLLVSVDNTVLGFALPAISSALGPSSAEQLWIIDIYPLVVAGLLVTMGTLGDRFGRRKMLLIGSTGFALVSVLAAFAPTAGALIAARAALGFFGAMLMPSTMSLLRSIFLDREQRRFAIAVWAAAFSAGAALGPIVGGFLLEHFDWGSVFLLAVPVLVPLLIAAPFLVPESRDPNPGRLDPLSILLSLLTMLPIVFAITSFAVDGPSPMLALSAAFGLAMGTLFVRRQRRVDVPMLDLDLFRRGSFSGAVLVNLLSMMSLVGFLYFVSQHLQLVMGLSPMEAGFALVPGMAMMIVSGLVVVPIARRVPPQYLVPGALVFSLAGYLLVAFSTQAHGVGPLVIAFAVLGIGIGAAETVSNELVVTTAPAAKAGAASAVSETAYEVGAVLGTAVLGGIITAFYRNALALPVGLPAGAGKAASETLAGAWTTAQDLVEPWSSALWAAAVTAFESGVMLTSLIGAGLVVLAAVVAGATLGRRAPDQ